MKTDPWAVASLNRRDAAVVERALARHGLTGPELAVVLGVSRQSVRLWRKGRTMGGPASLLVAVLAGVDTVDLPEALRARVRAEQG